ncbi:MAG: hypothetical protein INR70_20850 [Parafilimonas terrae]|jgi:hypothetical protein|nr:hypothetical protein [Parafilimonas terrae]
MLEADAVERPELSAPHRANTETRYFVRRLDKQGKTIHTHSIVALDRGEALELAYTVSGPGRAQLWCGAELLHEIEPFTFKRRPDHD